MHDADFVDWEQEDPDELNRQQLVYLFEDGVTYNGDAK